MIQNCSPVFCSGGSKSGLILVGFSWLKVGWPRTHCTITITLFKQIYSPLLVAHSNSH